MNTQEQFLEWINNNLDQDLEYTQEYLDMMIDNGFYLACLTLNSLKMTLYFGPEYIVAQNERSCYFIQGIDIIELTNEYIIISYNNKTCLVKLDITSKYDNLLSDMYFVDEQDINFEL